MAFDFTKIIIPLGLFFLISAFIVFCYSLSAYPAGPFPFSGRDFFIFWNGWYRVSLGQWPHADFYTPLGLASFTMPMVFAKAFGMTNGFYIMLMTSAAVSAIAIVLVFWKTKAVTTIFVFAIFGVSLAFSFVRFGDEFGNVVKLFEAIGATNHGFYRRIAAALCLPVVLYCFLGDTKSRNFNIILSVILAAFAYLVLMLKVTYFVFLLPLLAGAFFAKKLSKESLASGAITFLTLALVTEILFPSTFVSYARDLLNAVVISGGRKDFLNNIFSPFLNLANWILVAALVAYARLLRQTAAPVEARFYINQTLLLFVGLSFLNHYNGGPSDLVLLTAALAPLLLEIEQRTFSPVLSSKTRILVFLLLIALTPIGTRIASTVSSHASFRPANYDSQSIAILAGEQIYGRRRLFAYRVRKYIELDEEADALGVRRILYIKNKIVEDDDQFLDLASYIKAGSSLLSDVQEHENPKLLVLDLVDLFSIELNFDPPKHVPLWLDHRVSFNENCKAGAQRLLKRVNFVIVPNFSMAPKRTIYYMEQFNDELEKTFTLVRKNEFGFLYKKNDGRIEDQGPLRCW